MKLFKTLRKFTVKEKLNIIFSAYNSLSDFSKRRVGPCALARLYNRQQSTISNFLIRFVREGKDINKLIIKRSSTGKPIRVIGSIEIEQYLLSHKCLEDWAHLSILQRCEKIWNTFKVRVKRHKLQLFYKRHNIRWKAARAKYYPHHSNLQLLEAQRMEFAMKLTEYIFGDKPIIYLDQTTFRTDTTQKKAWYYAKSRFSIPLAKGIDKGCSITVFGALGECLKGSGFYYEIHESTNAISFTQFILNLAEQIVPLPQGVKPGIVIDNHNSGRGEREVLMKEYFEILRLPYYSSELNAIETVWSVLKKKSISQFTRLLIQKRGTKKSLIRTVEEEIAKIERQTFMNLCRAHYNDIESLLEKINEQYIYPMPVVKNNNQ